MKKIILFIFISFSSYNLYSYDSTAAKFYPLAVGNSWTYHYDQYPFDLTIIILKKLQEQL